MFSKKKVFKIFFQGISKKKKRSSKFFFRLPPKKNGLEESFSADLQNFTHSKNGAVLEPRTRQFSRTRGFEAKAKDLTLEAKAKDFKMCPRGHSRGLHLCFFPRKFAACWEPPSRDNHHKAPIQGHNNVTRVQVDPRSCNRGRCKINA